MSTALDDEPTPGDGDELTSDERTLGVLAHASGLAGFVIPLGSILGPLLVWASKKDESRFVAENGRQALNFQITWTPLVFGLGLLFVFLPPDPYSALLVFPVLGIVALAWLVLVTLAVVRANDGQVYEYPLTLVVFR